MNSQKRTTSAAAAPTGDFARPSHETVMAAAQKLINEREGIPPRIKEYLDTIRDGLQLLVDEQFAVKSIHDRYVRQFGWKISPAHLRTYLEEEFGYRPAAEKGKDKPAPVKKAAKKPAKKASVSPAKRR